MSQTGNKMAGYKAKAGGSKTPKGTADGKSTAPDAKNTISGTKVSTKEKSPTAWPQSRNRGGSYK